ncbi:hypothetical protein MERGE_000624, partial [Pneumocystis wakefieldiae]
MRKLINLHVIHRVTYIGLRDDRWIEKVAQEEAVTAQPVKREAPKAPGPKEPGAVPGLQQVKAEGIGEELVLALIVKSEYSDVNKCKTALEKYCEELKKTDPKLEKVNEKVKEFCGNGKEGKCKGLKQK